MKVSRPREAQLERVQWLWFVIDDGRWLTVGADSA